MNDDDHSADWGRDRRGLAADPDLLSRLAELLAVPAPPQSTWRAATVTLFATNPADITSAYLQHVQDLDWPVHEHHLLQHTITLLHHRVQGTTPP